MNLKNKLAEAVQTLAERQHALEKVRAECALLSVAIGRLAEMIDEEQPHPAVKLTWYLDIPQVHIDKDLSTYLHPAVEWAQGEPEL